MNRIILIVLVFVFSPTSYASTTQAAVFVYAFFGDKGSEFPATINDGVPNYPILSVSDDKKLVELYTAGNDDPWLNLTYVLENKTDSSQYFSIAVTLFTVDTVGPTTADAFMDLTLSDGNKDGHAAFSSPFASFTVAEERGGDNTPVQSIANIAPYSYYSGEGTYSVFDTGGPVVGPDSDTISDGSLGFNELRFLSSGYLSHGDSIELNAFACFANDYSSCPDRFIIPVSSVPLPAAAWLFCSGFLGLIGVARCKKAA